MAKDRKLAETKKLIRGAQAYNRAMRGGGVSGMSRDASNFISENPGATKKNAPRLTDKAAANAKKRGGYR